MKTFITLACLFFAIPAMGAIDVGVDFNQTGAVNSQGGIFNDFNRASSGISLPTSQTYTVSGGAALTVTILGGTGNGYTGNFNAGGFTNSGAFTYASLLNDFAYTGFDGNSLTVALSGTLIAPSKTYSLTVWAVDHNGTNNNQAETVSAVSGTTGTSGVINHGATVTAPTSNLDYSTTVNFTSDSSGVLTFSVFAGTPGSLFSERVNGFALNGVPEPTGAALLLGLLPILARRKRAA